MCVAILVKTDQNYASKGLWSGRGTGRFRLDFDGWALTGGIAVFNGLNAWLEAAHFAADVQRVIALRMMRIASGGPDAATEAQQMISEKLFAFGEAQIAILTAVMTGRSLEVAATRAFAPYQRCVRANSRRLGV